jgi:hypothetical protein
MRLLIFDRDAAPSRANLARFLSSRSKRPVGFLAGNDDVSEHRLIPGVLPHDELYRPFDVHTL